MDYRTQKELLGETRLSALFSPLLANRWLWLEAVAIPVIGVALCVLASPEDPFFLRAEFPWTWFAPVLVALRYGVMAGIVGAAILLGAWFVLIGTEVPFPKLYFLAGVILVMICGEYSTTWRTRLRRVGELNAYLTERFTRIMNQLNVLRISHDALEHDLITQPATLRDALHELRLLMASRGSGATLPAARELLVLLANHCQLEAATIYEVSGGTYIQRARLGDPPPLRANDSLLEYALERRALGHLQTQELAGRELPTEHLVVAPIVTSGDQLIGVLVVTRMPFFALNDDSLRVISLLLGLYADSVVVSHHVREVMAQVRGCPYEFADELVKLGRLHHDYGINSHIVVLQFGEHPERVDMMLFTTRLRRRFDVQWQFGGAEHEVTGIANLMPLASELAVRGYLERMESALRERFGSDFEGLAVRPYVISLEQHEPLAALARIVSGEASA
jgi:polysaccharide biosynthesis protein PelD